MARRPQDLLWQTRTVQAFLTTALEEAQYENGRLVGADLDPYSLGVVQPHYGIRGTSQVGRRNARYTGVIAALLSAFPPHLVRLGIAAVHALPAEERLAIELHWVLGFPAATVGKALRCTGSTVQRRCLRGAEQIARWLWTEDGQPCTRAPGSTG